MRTLLAAFVLVTLVSGGVRGALALHHSNQAERAKVECIEAQYEEFVAHLKDARVQVRECPIL